MHNGCSLDPPDLSKDRSSKGRIPTGRKVDDVPANGRVDVNLDGCIFNVYENSDYRVRKCVREIDRWIDIERERERGRERNIHLLLMLITLLTIILHISKYIFCISLNILLILIYIYIYCIQLL